MSVEPAKMQLNPDLNFIRQIKASGGDTLKKCFQCATCSVVCNLAPKNNPFPRKQMVLTQWGLKDRLLGDPNIWLCHQCNDCSKYCPRQARPGDVLASLRSLSFQHFAFPSFMGKALASPGSLPLLFLIPLLILLGVLIGSNGDLSYLFQFKGEVDYARAFPHGILEMIFIGGNVLIFAFAAVGLLRFWNNLQSHSSDRQRGLISSLLAVASELVSHSKFALCEETKVRRWGHLLTFYGFIGAMATAGLALFFTVILEKLGSSFYLVSPINLPNPIKVLGVLSGLALFIGGVILINQRVTADKVKSTCNYHDWLFLIVIFLVGITGMLAWILRLAGIPLIAYVDYYVHLVLVFFLLWYAPYSKFAHMFYRTLALTYAKSVGADLPRTSKAA